MRYGAVAYLNARPLVEGLAPLLLDTPARLAGHYEAGAVDVALLPVAAAEPRGIPRVGSLGIAAEGRVDSVLLFLRRPPEEVETLALDPASRSSRVLAEVILRAVYGREPHPARAAEADAELVIGDRALELRDERRRCLDLAEAWTNWTGLPFVFAAWYGAEAAEAELERAYARGRRRLADYAEGDARRERYLRERIRYRLGAREIAGLERFLETSRRLGLL